MSDIMFEKYTKIIDFAETIQSELNAHDHETINSLFTFIKMMSSEDLKLLEVIYREDVSLIEIINCLAKNEKTFPAHMTSKDIVSNVCSSKELMEEDYSDEYSSYQSERWYNNKNQDTKNIYENYSWRNSDINPYNENIESNEFSNLFKDSDDEDYTIVNHLEIVEELMNNELENLKKLINY